MTISSKQKTIKKSVALKGVGLHTGRKCKALFLPAEENSGIRFQRTDLPSKPTIKANLNNVVEVIRGTTLGQGDDRIYTIEHILSALNGLGITNLLIQLDDNEPPVTDGSSKEIVAALDSAGTVEQNADKKYFQIKNKYEYSANQTRIQMEPSDHFEIQCKVDYNHPVANNQTFIFNDSMDYISEIAPARTFCFDYEIEGLKKKGLAKGGSLDNSIVIGPKGIYNSDNFLRFENELVRHKILDLMGDLYLLGMPIKGKISAERCGHGHNINFLKNLLQERPLSSPLSVG